MKPIIGLALAAAALAPALAAAQEVTLRVVSAFPENQYYVKRTVEWIDKANKEGKGVLRMNFIGGAMAVHRFAICNLGKTPLVDNPLATRASHPNPLPHAHPLNPHQSSGAHATRNPAP